MYLFVKPLQCRPQDNLQTDALTARFLNQLQPSNLISEYFAWHPESTIHIKIPELKFYRSYLLPDCRFYSPEHCILYHVRHQYDGKRW